MMNGRDRLILHPVHFLSSTGWGQGIPDISVRTLSRKVARHLPLPIMMTLYAHPRDGKKSAGLVAAMGMGEISIYQNTEVLMITRRDLPLDCSIQKH